MKADNANHEVHQGSCWDCAYHDLTGTSFFGRCTWFERHGKGKSKEIPRDVVDKGCKFFEPRR